MRNNYSSVYLRRVLNIPDVSAHPHIAVRVYVDDGCVVWVNGSEVARFAAPDGPLTYDAVASFSHEAAWVNFVIEDPASVFSDGDNVIAVHALNQTQGNGDFSIDAELLVPAVWQFVFDSNAHDTTSKVVFADQEIDASTNVVYTERIVDSRFGPPRAGQSYALSLPERGGPEGTNDGYEVIAHIANLPYTQEYMCTKLCRIFVHEDFFFGGFYNVANTDPETRLLKACMDAWETPAGDGRKGNIRSVLSAIFSSDLFRSQAAARQKVKTPLEFTISAVRALRADLGGTFSASTDGYDFSQPMGFMGMGLYNRSQPDGYAEEGAEWIDTSTVNERMRFIQNFVMHPTDGMKDDDYGPSGIDNVCDPVALLKDRLPKAEWNDCGRGCGLLPGSHFSRGRKCQSRSGSASVHRPVEFGCNRNT